MILISWYLRTTAYGAEVKVPGNVDILIAGTSCVDYSTLNNEKQDIDANGESGRTFRGMMSWVEKHRPPLVILENVCSAPWARICDFFKRKKYLEKKKTKLKRYFLQTKMAFLLIKTILEIE